MNTSTETKLYLGYTGLQVGFCIGFLSNHTYVAHRKTYHMNWKKKIFILFLKS